MKYSVEQFYAGPVVVSFAVSSRDWRKIKESEQWHSLVSFVDSLQTEHTPQLPSGTEQEGDNLKLKQEHQEDKEFRRYKRSCYLKLVFQSLFTFVLGVLFAAILEGVSL